MDIIKKDTKISYKKIAEILKINISAIQKHIEKLKNLALLTHEGADFGGYWKVLND